MALEKIAEKYNLKRPEVKTIEGKINGYYVNITDDNVVKKLKEYKKDGFKILIFTARQMRTHGGNLGLINVHTSRMTMDWLDKWNIPYDEIIFGKPWPGKGGFYIDDRAIRPDEFLKYNEDELNKMLDDARERITKE